MPKKLVYEEYRQVSKELNKHPVPDSTFGKELKQIIPSLQIARREEGEKKTSFYVFPSYEIASKDFDNYKMGRKRRS